MKTTEWQRSAQDTWGGGGGGRGDRCIDAQAEMVDQRVGYVDGWTQAFSREALNVGINGAGLSCCRVCSILTHTSETHNVYLGESNKKQ